MKLTEFCITKPRRSLHRVEDQFVIHIHQYFSRRKACTSSGNIFVSFGNDMIERVTDPYV